MLKIVGKHCLLKALSYGVRSSMTYSNVYNVCFTNAAKLFILHAKPCVTKIMEDKESSSS